MQGAIDMKIELRNIKYADFASHETACYQASVFIDGAKVGETSNAGHGGADNVYPHEVAERIDAYAATLPPFDYDGYVIAQNHETIFGDLLNAWVGQS
jgi:hypothetical protein